MFFHDIQENNFKLNVNFALYRFAIYRLAICEFAKHPIENRIYRRILSKDICILVIWRKQQQSVSALAILAG